ncbi:hypothetical protein [Herminiimonas contaminans]|uniref:Uncharacterized protein n=1 Tax=Herminiimonas contaminans TaxID=1111140 RepID=A0ABS0EQX5_9BURK|nr:hypothetical protein [Herminiimonas contaminans]MBF8177255.1 hypothetical protein [Herminiimonas contaminans]
MLPGFDAVPLKREFLNLMKRVGFTPLNPANLVHRTGNESIAGIKDFSDSPTVPTPTLPAQAVSKAYADQFIALLPIIGLLFSTAGASNAMTLSAGRAADSTGSVVMSLASSITKTTAAWAVGNAGGLDTGTIANSTWYHFYEIRRPDTGVVDWIFSLSPTVPTLPTNYTQYRHIGFGFINASTQWRRFFHDGDDWTWDAPTLDIDVTGPGATAVSRVLAVPTGISVIAKFNYAAYDPTNANGIVGYFSDLRAQDLAPSNVSAPLSASSSASQSSVGGLSTQEVRTNISAQIRSRINAVSGTAVLKMSTIGWTYKRGG